MRIPEIATDGRTLVVLESLGVQIEFIEAGSADVLNLDWSFVELPFVVFSDASYIVVMTSVFDIEIVVLFRSVRQQLRVFDK